MNTRFCRNIWRDMRQAVVLGFLMWLAPSAPSAEAEALGLNSLRTTAQNTTRSAINSIRTIIRPTLGIVRGRAGPVTALHLSDDRNLLLVILGDGSVRFWDLRRGVQLGSAIGNGIISGRFRGAGSDAVAVRRDGALFMIRADGTLRHLAARMAFPPTTATVVSGDGRGVAFRATVGDWHWMHVDSGSSQRLGDAAHDTQPILSLDGLKIAYRTERGVWVVRNIGVPAVEEGGVELGTCVRDGVRALTGAFTPDGSRIVFGDERGGLCVWAVSGPGSPKRFIAQQSAYSGAIELLAIGSEGQHVALGGDGQTVTVWAIAPKIRRQVSLKLTGGRPGSLLMDAERGWLLVGEPGGTVGVYSLREEMRIARLVSMDRGWAVLDREGRFDGSQNGFDSLVWASETESDTLPLASFSKNHHEPGLLAKLNDASPVFLNEDIRNLSEDGYVRPPKITIDPVNVRDTDPQGRLRIRVQVEPGYCCEVAEIRLYHNGKLFSSDRDTSDGDYLVRLLPGENIFTVVGVGPGGVEGPSASASVTTTAPESPSLSMRIIAIGIDDYNLPSWQLQNSRNDADAVLDTLRQRASAVFDDVKTIKLLDSAANLQAIKERITENMPSPDDVLVVFLAGHGYALQQRENKQWEWYFLPFTTVWSEGVDWETMLPRHGLSSQQLMSFLTKAAARRVFLILDSCKSGAVVDMMNNPGGWMLTDSAGQKALSTLARVGGIHVLAASRAEEDAVELNTVPHGALTYLVLEGMGVGGTTDADKNQDNKFSIREIIGYANKQMPLLAKRLIQERISQNPVDYSYGEDFVLGEL
ncbi:caspase family protein [Candidatus Spongiihabitans sp.]|uniref:caspase family protein n=1 Tax=Candidatus Spongiihabitans sp. TaxID=3101308 RepID=UPI003C7A162A